MDDTQMTPKETTPKAAQNIKPTDGPDFDSLSARERDLRAQIAQLQDYVEHAPERELQAIEEQMRTLPPPEEIIERRRQKEFMDKLSRGELKNEKRHQAKSGFLLFLLIMATLALGLWIYQAVQ